MNKDIEEYLRWREMENEPPPIGEMIDVWLLRPDRGGALSVNIWNGCKWEEKPYGRVTHWRHSTTINCPPTPENYWEVINEIRSEFGLKPLKEDSDSGRSQSPSLFDIL